jgi:hypothetical protein
MLVLVLEKMIVFPLHPTLFKRPREAVYSTDATVRHSYLGRGTLARTIDVSHTHSVLIFEWVPCFVTVYSSYELSEADLSYRGMVNPKPLVLT